MPLRMVGTSHQGACLDVPEAHREASLLQHVELVRMDEAINGQMALCRLKILSKGEDITTDFP